MSWDGGRLSYLTQWHPIRDARFLFCATSVFSSSSFSSSLSTFLNFLMDPSQAPEVILQSKLDAFRQHEAYHQNDKFYCQDGKPLSHNDKFYYPSERNPGVHTYSLSSNGWHPEKAALKVSKVPERQILGLRRTTFWLSLVLVIVVIAAGIGGTIAGIAFRDAHNRLVHEKNGRTKLSRRWRFGPKLCFF